MKKIFYIEYVDKNELIGVINKVNAQCNEFSKYYETILLYLDGNDICINNFNKMKFKKIKNVLGRKKLKSNTILKKINNRIKIIKFNLYIKKILLEEKPEIIYVRKYEILNGIRILKNFKKKNNAHIIYEIPTYPYEQEYLKNGKKIMRLLNKKLDKGMEKIAELIPVVLGQDVEFTCKKYLPISNGIDIKNINIKNINKVKGNIIDLIGVANVSFWHGYDRLIEGLKNYYTIERKNKVIFHIVGDGDEINNLKQLTKKYKLNDYVLFHGIRNGKELDEIMDYCEIGIGSIANHRKGLKKDSALKNREYCARGIPFVVASEDDAFKDFKYIYKISPDETPVNINNLLDFYNNIKNEDYINEMREYAENNLTWEVIMKPIVNAINTNI
ncbi:glycosyltransferase family 4 protein [Clostridium botulinum]|nr:glycosyltransferase family 4 protein [Clostridium botulinum]NFS95153.1 glycosyltransferase family 4 protein [Clostridium botulinum]